MQILPLLGLLLILSPQLARAQAAPPAEAVPKAAPAPKAAAPKAAAPKPAAAKPAAKPAPEASAPAVAPPAPAAPPGVFPQAEAQAVEPAPAPDAAPGAPPIAGPYPYGYGYGPGYPPAALDPARNKTLGDLQRLDLRIATVRKQQKQYSLTGPIAMMAAGYGAAMGLALIAVLQWAVADDIKSGNCDYYSRRSARERCDVDDDGEIDKHDERYARGLARGFGAAAGVLAGVGIGGTVFLVRRLAKRRQYSPELNELGTRRGQLLQQLQYGGGYSQNTFQLTLSGRF